MKTFNIADWVQGLQKSELEALEEAVVANSANPCGNMSYFIKPYVKFVPIHNKLEVILTNQNQTL